MTDKKKIQILTNTLNQCTLDLMDTKRLLSILSSGNIEDALRELKETTNKYKELICEVEGRKVELDELIQLQKKLNKKYKKLLK